MKAYSSYIPISSSSIIIRSKMYCLTVILSLCLAVNALYGQLRDQRVLGKTTCGNPKLVPQCCYSLDYSGKDVACVGMLS